MKFAMMILRRSLTPIVGTVLFTSTRIHEPRRIPPLSIASRSRLPVENDVSVWATGDRILGFTGAWFSNFVLGSRLNLPLSKEKSARSHLTLTPLSLFTTIVLNLRLSSSEEDRVTIPSTRFGRSPRRPPSLTRTTPTLLSSGSESIADSIIRRPSSLVFLRVPSQLSMTLRPLSLERFSVRTLLKTSSGSDTRISSDPWVGLSLEVFFENGSCISWIQGKCFRSLLGGTRLGT